MNSHCVQHHDINMILNYRGCLCWCSTTMRAVDFERRLEGGNMGDVFVGCFSQFFIKPLMYD